jgi:hypothetical protein
MAKSKPKPTTKSRPKPSKPTTRRKPRPGADHRDS